MPPPRPTFWQRCRRLGRWSRIAFLSVLLALTGFLIYCNQVGLPNALKAPIQAQLRAHGLDLEYERLRLRWLLGIVAESVNLGSSRDAFGPQAYADEVQIHLDTQALLRGRVKVESVFLRRGKLALPLALGGEPRELFQVDGIMSMLKFHPDGRWELNQFQADCLGARLQFSGIFSNAASARASRPPPGSPSRTLGALDTPLWQATLRQANRIASRLQFQDVPTLNLVIQGDARDPTSLRARLHFSTTGARTPWGTVGSLLLSGQLNQTPNTNQISFSRLHLNLGQLQTPWGHIAHLDATTSLVQSFTNPVPNHLDWDVSLERLKSPHLDLPQARLLARTDRLDGAPQQLHTSGTLQAGPAQTHGTHLGSSDLRFTTSHRLDQPIPLEATWQGQVRHVQTGAAHAESLTFSGQLAPSTDPTPEPPWGPWSPLAPYALDLQAHTPALAAQGLDARPVSLALTWRPPLLSITRSEAQLLGGQTTLSAALDVASRHLQLGGRTSLIPRLLLKALPKPVAAWLEQVTWEQPLHLELEAHSVLPPWDHPVSDLWEATLPSLELHGALAVTNLAFRQVPLREARARFALRHHQWTLSDLQLIRPEGRLWVSGASEAPSREFQLRIHESSFDPQALRPALPPGVAKAFGYFELQYPPWISGDVRGRWDDPRSLGVQARLAVTNVTIRGQPLDEIQADLTFTNLFLVGTNVVVRRLGQVAGAEALGYDIPATMLHFTNTYGRMDPSFITRIIGPKTAQALEPYHFLQPPQITLNGRIATRGNADDDALFDIQGGPFTWWRFRVPQIAGRVHWLGQSLTVSNLQASFYGGRLEGGLAVRLPRGEPATLGFTARTYDADLHAMMADLTTPTNNLEGRLNATLIVDSLDTSDMDSWQGHGWAELNHGFLWATPLFGLFSPLLNSFRPGLGDSRATAGTATYTITNSVIRTQDLSIRTSAMRLNYDGTVDFQGRLAATVEAELMRDSWVLPRLVGWVMTPLTKLFVYKVTGTLTEPEMKPLHVPKFLLAPLQPVQTLKELFGPDKRREKPPPRRNR